jgi:hypothetical protein
MDANGLVFTHQPFIFDWSNMTCSSSLEVGVIRNKRIYSGPVRRSRRIRGRYTDKTPIRQQQRALMVQLGIAREGEIIGDEALNAYLDLFTRPFRPQHLDVVLRLFGWSAEDLQPLVDTPVDCLT